MAASVSAAVSTSNPLITCTKPCTSQHHNLDSQFVPLKLNTPLSRAQQPWLAIRKASALRRSCGLVDQRHGLRTVMAQSGDGVTSNSGVASKSKEIVPDTEFNVAKVSFGTIGVFLGVALLGFGFGSYFQLTPGGDFSALLLTYGFPLFLIGCALKYAELKPVPIISYADAYALRATQATPILEQVRNDVTRFRYGDEQHLEEALKRIFRYGQGGGISRRDAPVLTAIREETQNGRYTLTLIFSSKLSKAQWDEKQAKFTSFFGPDVTAEIVEAGNDVFEVKLIADGGPK